MVLSFSILGTVEQVLVEEGQSVKRGQVVARIAARSYQDALGIARVKANQAEDAYRRLKPMADNKTLPEIKFVEVQSGLEQARLSVSMAAKNVQDSTLRAPEAGLVAKRSVEPGSSVAPGVPVITLVQTQTVFATVPVPETQIAQVKKGDLARVTVTALQRTFAGTVREIGVVAEPLTRSYAVKVALDNREGLLRVGMVADVELSQPLNSKVVAVPPEAVRIDETGATYVFVVQNQRVLQQRKVSVVGYVGEGAAIAQGLSPDELVVVSGTPMLADSMVVHVAERDADAGQVP